MKQVTFRPTPPMLKIETLLTLLFLAPLVKAPLVKAGKVTRCLEATAVQIMELFIWQLVPGKHKCKVKFKVKVKVKAKDTVNHGCESLNPIS